MLLVLIKFALGFSAFYGFAMWLYIVVLLTLHGKRLISDAKRAEIELYTFHLGICAIVAAGLLGIILVQGG